MIIDPLFLSIKQRANYLALLFLFYSIACFSQKELIDTFSYVCSNKIKALPTNPYKVISNGLFFKSDQKVYYCASDFKEDFKILTIDVKDHKSSLLYLDTPSLISNLEPGYTDLLIKYGFSEFNAFGSLFISKIDDKGIILTQKDSILRHLRNFNFPDLRFNEFRIINDSTLALLVYPVGVLKNKHYEVYLFNFNTGSVKKIYEANLTSAIANYIYEYNNRIDVKDGRIVVSDNINYSIAAFDANGNMLFNYHKDIGVDTNDVNAINRTKHYKTDSILKYLNHTPRIYNVQWLNDSVIVVNYATKPSFLTESVRFQDSKIDFLTIRNNTVIKNKTFSDDFVLLEAKPPKNFTRSTINPYLRLGFPFYFINGALVYFGYDKSIPNSKKDIKKYISQSKNMVLNLKSAFEFSIYTLK